MTQPLPVVLNRFSYGIRMHTNVMAYPWAVMDGHRVVALAATEDAAKELVVHLYLSNYPGGAA